MKEVKDSVYKKFWNRCNASIVMKADLWWPGLGIREAAIAQGMRVGDGNVL